MLGEKHIPPALFGAFRILLGLYLTVHFVQLLPYGAELFSREGIFPDPAVNLTYGLFPNPLALWDGPRTVTLFLAVLAGLSVIFALGLARRVAALLLWFGWAALFHRNNLISNPSIPYVGLLLLLTTLVPPGERLRPGRKRPAADWSFPASVWWTAWLVLAAGYTYSGLVKLGSPSWLDGSALSHVLENPLARPNVLRELLLGLPRPVLTLLTWSALGVEILALPLSVHRWTRLASWASLVALQLGILSVVSFADLTAGMLLAHLFVVDPAWWSRCNGARPQGSAGSEGIAGSAS